jgi:type I restriction enzyme S subunit
VTFTTHRLKTVATINDDKLPDDTAPDYEFRYVDIGSVGRGTLTEQPQTVRFSNAPSRARRIVRKGDILVSTVRTYLRAVLPIRPGLDDVIASTGFAVIRPTAVDPEFAGWLLQSDTFIEEVVARSVGVSYPAINAMELGDVRVPIPPLPAQKAIASYLDQETTRIDTLIVKYQRLAKLISEREYRILSEAFVPVGTPCARLGYFATLQGGITVDSARIPGPTSVTLPYLRVANVQNGWLNLKDVAKMTVPRVLARKATLRKGDVLMTEGGDLDKLGRGTLWQGEIETCLHQNHIFALRTNPSLLDPEYLALLTRSSHARWYFESTGTRTTNLASTNSTKIMGLPIPQISVGDQRKIVDAFSEVAVQTKRMGKALTTQIGLLAERRQAVITAAVTGELDIPGVRT